MVFPCAAWYAFPGICLLIPFSVFPAPSVPPAVAPVFPASAALVARVVPYPDSALVERGVLPDCRSPDLLTWSENASP
ncbi:MAG: hypothetical protein LBO79_01490 [Zoogloeaceae bacterium]|jgi:hypothetical protein|nr:hypothetical protein [Zoogloeaceae bacterium]